MDILFTLCGRAGSKGVKGKNARDFLDIPLVWYSMAGICLYIKKYIKPEDHVDIVLNTDSKDLMALVKQVNALNVSVFERDESLAGDRVPIWNTRIRVPCRTVVTMYWQTMPITLWYIMVVLAAPMR